MAIKALIFGTDDLFPQLQPFYVQQMQIGNLEVVGQAVIENNQVKILSNNAGGGVDFQIAIISSQNNFYNRMKFLESQGIPRKNIIDGRVFQVPNLDFQKFLDKGVAYGVFPGNTFLDAICPIYKRIYRNENSLSGVELGIKSYIGVSKIDGHHCRIKVGNYSSISWSITFEALPANDHHYENINTYSMVHFDWYTNDEFARSQKKYCKINIGSDVWMGRGTFLKCSSLKKPLTIGDGAVIASDSVVVKDVPPYAIVGGNPAKIIKYRFPEKIIESLLRIKWWDWDIDKIYENFKYFNRVEEFVEMHDKKI